MSLVSITFVQENISNAHALTASHGDWSAMVYGNVQGAEKRCIAIIQHVQVCLDVKTQASAYLWIIYVIRSMTAIHMKMNISVQ